MHLVKRLISSLFVIANRTSLPTPLPKQLFSSIYLESKDHLLSLQMHASTDENFSGIDVDKSLLINQSYNLTAKFSTYYFYGFQLSVKMSNLTLRKNYYQRCYYSTSSTSLNCYIDYWESCLLMSSQHLSTLIECLVAHLRFFF